MFSKIFKITKIFFPAAVVFLMLFLIQAGQARAVEIRALRCNGGGATLPNMTVIFSNASVPDGRNCRTGSSGTCTIPTKPSEGGSTLPAGVYNISIPMAGYTIERTAPCLTPLTYDTTNLIPFLDVYLTPSTGGTTGGGATGGTTGGIHGLTNKPLATIINDITLWLLGIVALIAVLFIIIGGVYYMTSGGDERRIESAKSTITYAILGLFVAAIAYATVLLVNKLIGT